MRILYTTLNLQKAGSHVVAITLASGMAERQEVFYFNHNEQLVDAGMLESYFSPGVQLLDMNTFPRLNKVLWKVNGLLKRLTGYNGFHEASKTIVLLYLIARHKIDLIHGHEILVQGSRLARVARFLSVPIVITDHNGYTMLLKVGNTSFVPYANKAKAIIAVSEYTARVLRAGSTPEDSAELRAMGNAILAKDHQAEYNSLKANQQTLVNTPVLTVPVTTIYNGVVRYEQPLPGYQTIRQELNIPAEALVFGMVGRGTEQKGWRYALGAYQQLTARHPQRAFVWLCMGDGPCLQEIQAELGSSRPDILFLGNVDNPHYYMSVCNVGLVPSCFSEGLPLSIVEFYEHQVPVIASDLCGIPEVIAPADAEPGGLLIEMESDATPRMASLLQHMEQYVNQPALLEKHSKSAFLIRQRFDMQQFVDSHESLYKKVLSSIQ